MSSLQSLIDKVINDAKETCDKILSENKIECDKIIEDRVEEAEEKHKEIIEKAHSEASVLYDKIISGEELRIRNEKLKAKQESINKILKDLNNKLLNLNEKEYLQYLNNGLSSIDGLDNAEVIVAQKFKKSSEKVINGLNNNLRISKETLKNNDGFMVIKDKVTMDFTFLKIIDFYKESLEKIIVEQLFQEKKV